MLPAQLSAAGSVVTQKLWAASVALAGLSGMALQRSPVAALPCAGSHGQAAFVPLCHPDYKCGHQGWLKLREKLGNFVDMGLLSCVGNDGQVKLGRKDTSQPPWESLFLNMDGIFCGTALDSRVVQTPGFLEIQWTIRQKNPHIVCHSGYVLAVNEYKDLFITPSAHIADRLNHSLAVKMTVAQ